jgi:hypothetical protein
MSLNRAPIPVCFNKPKSKNILIGYEKLREILGFDSYGKPACCASFFKENISLRTGFIF